jgi:membrane-bound lytic murein transglycosylase D
MKRVAACFALWPLIAALHFQVPLRDGDAIEDTMHPVAGGGRVAGSEGVEGLSSGWCGPEGPEPREPCPGGYGAYAAFYADGGRWSEFSAPGIAVAGDRRVERYVERFRTTRRSDFEHWLRRSGRYLPLVRRILVENGLPGELVCLAMVESGFDAKAVSGAQAVGLWQFMPETARRYGLRVDAWVDERLDPEKSTQAAARYLRDLYRKYESWDLAIAAYNAGERRINRVLRRTGRRDFWQLARRGFFHRETRYHVIKFNAAVAIIRDLEGSGFTDLELDPPIRFDTVVVPAGTPLRRIAEVLHAPVDALTELNPQLIRGLTPPGVPSWPLRVPVGTGEMVLEGVRASTLS